MENTGVIWKIATIALGVLFLIAIIFVVVFSLKISNFDKNKAVEISDKLAVQQEDLAKKCQLEKEVVLNKYTADDVYGNFSFTYPKVWFTNVKRTTSSPSLAFLAHPSLITLNSNSPSIVTLRVMVYERKYVDQTKNIDRKYKSVPVTVSGFKGVKLTGVNRETKRTESYILVPLRDKTLYIGTDDIKLYKDPYEKILASFKINK